MSESQRASAMAFFMDLGMDPEEMKEILEKSGAPSPDSGNSKSATPDPSPQAEEEAKSRRLRELSDISSVFGSALLDLGDPNPKNFPPRGSRDSFGNRSRTSSVTRPSLMPSLDEVPVIEFPRTRPANIAGFETETCPDMSAPQQKAVSMPDEPSQLLMQRSRSGSGASKSKYIPPKGKYSAGGGTNPDDYKQWMEWDTQELEKRKRALIGKTVVGKLSPQRGNRYFVKWNINANDTIVISADKVEEVLGENAPAGMWVSCTIVGLGPGHVAWNKQHPYAMTLESRETRASHQPKKGKMARNSAHWKKAQKVGLSKPVVTQISSRQTVPAELDMARYIAGRSRPVPTVPETHSSLDPAMLTRSASATFNSPPPPGSILASLPLSESLPEGIVLEPTVVPPNDPNETFATRINGANINLVTGEIRRRGRAESAGSWRKRDRSFTV